MTYTLHQAEEEATEAEMETGTLDLVEKSIIPDITMRNTMMLVAVKKMIEGIEREEILIIR